MKRPTDRSRGMTRDYGIEHDEDVTEANPVVEAAPRNLARRFENRPEPDTPIDYGDYGGRTPGDEPEEETQEEAPVVISRNREEPKRRAPANEGGSSMSAVMDRVRKKREERNGGGAKQPERMVMKEFAQPDPVQQRKAVEPPKVDPQLPSATLNQVPEHKVFPPGLGGEAPQGWTRQGLPSHGVPYDDFDDVFVRVLEVPDILAIHASITNGSYTMFLDALNNACNVDIRDLTGPDFRFLMYWWRLNSFTRSPYTLTWTSRYGNENKTMIAKESELEIVELAMSREEYMSRYRSQGIDFPRVRDAEYLGDVRLSPTDRWLAERAQYIITEETGDRWYPSRFDKLKAGGVPLMELVRDFSREIKHGVVERVKVVDEKFEPYSAVEQLRRHANYLLGILRQGTGLTTDLITEYGERAEEYLAEADEIEEKLVQVELATSDEPEGNMSPEEANAVLASIKPREEAIALKIDAMDFFPEI